MQLKEIYEESYNEKQAVVDENKKLKELLRMNGIPYRSREQSSATAFESDPAPGPASSQSASAYGYGMQSQQRLSPVSHLQGSVGNSPSFGGSEYYTDQSGLSSRSALSPHSALLGSQQQQHQQPQQAPTGAQQTHNPMVNDYQLGVEFVLASVPPSGDGQNLGHTPPPPPHHLPSQNFPVYDPHSR